MSRPLHPPVAIADLERFLGASADEWPGKCSWVADRLLNSGLLRVPDSPEGE